MDTNTKKQIEIALHQHFADATPTQIDRIRTYADQVFTGKMTFDEAVRRVAE